MRRGGHHLGDGVEEARRERTDGRGQRGQATATCDAAKRLVGTSLYYGPNATAVSYLQDNLAIRGRACSHIGVCVHSFGGEIESFPTIYSYRLVRCRQCEQLHLTTKSAARCQTIPEMFAVSHVLSRAMAYPMGKVILLNAPPLWSTRRQYKLADLYRLVRTVFFNRA